MRRRRCGQVCADHARRMLLRKTCPRVTNAEWAALRQMAAEIDAAGARIREMRADLEAVGRVLDSA